MTTTTMTTTTITTTTISTTTTTTTSQSVSQSVHTVLLASFWTFIKFYV
jgi:hypothetical protein